MKLIKLNMRGFSHQIIGVFAVLAIAVVGTGLLVASHAQVPPEPSGSKLSCTITAPTSIKAGQSVSPYATIKNGYNNTENIKPTMSIGQGAKGAAPQPSVSIAAFSSKNVSFGTWTTGTTSAGQSVSMAVDLSNPYLHCARSISVTN